MVTGRPDGVLVVPVGVVGHEHGIVRGMIENDVNHHLEAQVVGGGDETGEVVFVAKFGVDLAVVGDGVGRAKPTFAMGNADGMDGHEPDDVDAHAVDARQISFDVGEGTVGAVVTGVDFVEDEVAVVEGCVRSHGRRRGGGKRGGEEMVNGVRTRRHPG